MAITIDGAGTITGLSATGISAQPVFPGNVLQVVSTIITSGSSSTTSGTFVSTGFDLSITPSSASSKVFVIFNFNNQAQSGIPESYSTIFRGATNILNSNGNLVYDNNTTNIHVPVTLCAVDSPSTTSATTYSLRHRAAGGSTSNISTEYGAVAITLMEIAG